MDSNMNIENLHQRIDTQIAQASGAFGQTVSRLNFSTDIFKPDSPKFETVVSLEIGCRDVKTGCIRSNHFFYSPRSYAVASIAKLKAEIESYLKSRQLECF